MTNCCFPCGRLVGSSHSEVGSSCCRNINNLLVNITVVICSKFVSKDNSEIIRQKLKLFNFWMKQNETKLRRKKNNGRNVSGGARRAFREQHRPSNHVRRDRHVISRGRVTWPDKTAAFIRNPCTTIRLTLRWWGAGQSLSIPERR